MNSMNWILIAYLIALLYLALNRSKLPNPLALRSAWIAFALIPISHFVFTLFRIGNLRDPRALALVELWADGIAWLLLGISFLFLTASIAPASREYPDIGPKNFPPPLA